MTRRLALGAVTLTLLVAGVMVVLAQEVPPRSPDRAEHYSAAEPITPLLPGARVDQVVERRDRGPMTVYARFGTYGGVQDCIIDVTARRAGRVLSEVALPCADLADNEVVEVAFVPEDGAPGDSVALSFEGRSNGTQAPALWGGEPDGGHPAAELDGDRLDGAVEVYTRYGAPGRVWDRVGTILDRAQQYRAWWGAPAAVVVLLVMTVGGLAGLVVVPNRARLPLLLAVVAAKGILWSVVLPPLETPDEPAHFAYAQFVAEERRLPDRYEQHDGLGPFSDQLLVAIDVVRQPLLKPGDRPDFGPGPEGPDEARPDGESRHSGGGGNPAAGYAPPYFLGAAAMYALPPTDFFTSLSTVRLWSVALGVVAIWLVVGIGRRALRSEPAALALGVAVGFQPVWTQATAGVNNDAAVVLAGAGCTLVALDLALSPRRRHLALVSGLVLGGAVLTKPFAAAFAGPMLLGWVIGRIRERDLPTTWWRDVGAALVGVLATFGSWMVLARLLGIPMVTTDDHAEAPGKRTVGQYLHRLTEDGWHTLHLNWVERLWGNLSWTDTPPPPTVVSWVARLTVAVLVVGVVWVLVALVDAFRQRRRPPSSEYVDRLVATLVLGVAVVSTFGLLHLIELRWFLRTNDTTLLAGRYAMMTLPAIIGVIPLMVRRLAPKVPVAASTVALASGVLVLHLVALHTIVERFYL